MTKPLLTPLYNQHLSSSAKMMDFGGWSLPANYGSQIQEHNAVRSSCGMFDVSHMTVSDVTGLDTLLFVRKLLANNIDKVTHMPGKAIYSCMLNEEGGVIDDLIVYYLTDQHCRFVTNANTKQKVLDWFALQAASFNVVVTERPELALLAVQGPDAVALSSKVCSQVLSQDFSERLLALKRFQGFFAGDAFAGRTGYTGEDGFEFIVDPSLVSLLWEGFLAAGVQPCGLGARDTLRLESGMSLYGNELDEEHTPLDSGLGWSVDLKTDRDFIGKSGLRSPSQYYMMGLLLQDRGVLRGHQKVMIDGQVCGETTSGTFSPTLQRSIGLARINSEYELKVGDTVQVLIRNKPLEAVVSRYPFVK